MNKFIHNLLIALFLIVALRAQSQQQLEYGFTGQYVSVYNPIQGGTALWTGTFDDAISSPISIPPIVFGGQERTSLRINTNGWVAFGNANSSTNYTPMSSNVTGADGVIAVLAGDLISADAVNSAVRYVIDGDLITIEWQKVRRYSATPGTESINFQLIIDAAIDALYFMYDVEAVDDYSWSPQVGMKAGAVAPAAGQFVNRSVTVDNTWLTSVAGTTNTSGCLLTGSGAGSYPESGLTYAWNGAGGGCNDPAACNYDEQAQFNNGSCDYCSCVTTCGCTDELACNYDIAASYDNGSCDYTCLGCTDELAMNFDADATIENGSCIYAGDGSFCSNPSPILCGNQPYSALTFGVENDNATSGALACGGGSNGGQRWYIYQALFTSEITVSTINAGTNFDTYLKVFTGTCGDLICVAQNDDAPGSGFQSQLTFTASLGETYLIRVGGFASSVGTFVLTFDCGGGCLDEAACNYEPGAPFDDGSCTYGADCFGCTDPDASNFDPVAVYDQGCQYTPQITVFHDVNGDGMKQMNEPGLPNWPVYIPAVSATIFSNASGAVSITLPASDFELQLLNDGDDWISSNSSVQSIAVPSNMVAAFGLIPAGGETFLVAGPYDGFWDIIHCEDGYEAGVFINNTGAVPLNGTLTMSCDASFLPEADSYLTIAPDQVAAGFAQWNIADFGAGLDGLFSFHIDGPGLNNIGVTYPFEFVLTLVDDEGNTIYNESWTTTPMVACAYDPNDLTATPAGYEAPHFILPGERIRFRVRFQNTGNFPAEDVLIIDDLDPQVFDIASFAPVYGSADYVACLHDDGTIDFIFEDIYLPDAENNEEESHGFVVFEVDARQDLIPGTVLLNEAAIFFDSNPAIITNEIFHTIFDCTSFTPMNGDTQLCEGENISLEASQPYVEYYNWTLNGEDMMSASQLSISQPEAGVHEVVLVTGNPLCFEEHFSEVLVHQNPLLDVGEDVSVCSGEEVTLNANSSEMVVWSDGIVNGESFVPETSMTATASVTNIFECSTSEDLVITVLDLPSAAVTQQNEILTAADGTAWQWYLNGDLIPGATGQSISASEGSYHVVVTNAAGCSVTSEAILVTSIVSAAHPEYSVYPNPMNDVALIKLPEGSFDIRLSDVTGRLVLNMNGRSGQVMLERGTLPAGQYHLQICDNSSTHFVKILMR